MFKGFPGGPDGEESTSMYGKNHCNIVISLQLK